MSPILFDIKQAVDLAVSGPDISIINISVLNPLLHIIIRELGLEKHQVEFHGEIAKSIEQNGLQLPLNSEIVLTERAGPPRIISVNSPHDEGVQSSPHSLSEVSNKSLIIIESTPDIHIREVESSDNDVVITDLQILSDRLLLVEQTIQNLTELITGLNTERDSVPKVAIEPTLDRMSAVEPALQNLSGLFAGHQVVKNTESSKSLPAEKTGRVTWSDFEYQKEDQLIKRLLDKLKTDKTFHCECSEKNNPAETDTTVANKRMDNIAELMHKIQEQVRFLLERSEEKLSVVSSLPDDGLSKISKSIKSVTEDHGLVKTPPENDQISFQEKTKSADLPVSLEAVEENLLSQLANKFELFQKELEEQLKYYENLLEGANQTLKSDLHQAMVEIQEMLNAKVNNCDIANMKHYFCNLFETYKQDIKTKFGLQDTIEAAATSKMLTDLNCLSCRKVVAQNKFDCKKPPALPIVLAGRGAKKGARPCGGKYTRTWPEERIERKGNFLDDFGVVALPAFKPVYLEGDDGHIYVGAPPKCVSLDEDNSGTTK